MKNKYIDLIEQTFDFPQKEFEVVDNELLFNKIPLMDLIKQYGTPLKITYLPKISENIQRCKRWFRTAMAKVDYQSDYFYSYCTKSSHFSFVMDEVLKNDTHIECSSAYDIPIVKKLYVENKLTKKTFITCNGFKTDDYKKYISGLINDGFENTVPILDNKDELEDYKKMVKGKFKIGIRIATEEEPRFSFYTSRLGIRYDDIIDFYRDNIKDKKIELKMLHFFINTGIKDNSYYWNELNKAINLYCKLKKECPELEYFNIGGGFPIKTSLTFNYDYRYMVDEIVAQIKKVCNENGVLEPHIFTEFGSFTVGESAALLLSVKKQKRQNDRELWNMVDTSFITTLPDLFLINQKFIMLSVNNWDSEYERVNLGGYSCDSTDFISEADFNAVYLPNYSEETEQYIGIFNVGAYQDQISGLGGIKHCLVPSPKHVLITDGEDGEFETKIFSKEQSYQSMLKILGY